MPPLRGVLFDVGGTLVSNTFSITQEAFERRCVERLTAALGEEQPWYRELAANDFPGSGVDPATLGQDVAGEVARFLASIDASVEPGRLPAIQRACALPLPELVELRPGASAAVRGARALGLRLAICSNTFWRDDRIVEDDWRAFGLGDCFDAYVTSTGTGYAKPHRAIFERTLAAIGLAAEEAAMVGDRLREDVHGGHAAGMRTVWVRCDGDPLPTAVAADAVIESLDQLEPVLRAWSS